jgi:hypothetical protein
MRRVARAVLAGLLLVPTIVPGVRGQTGVTSPGTTFGLAPVYVDNTEDRDVGLAAAFSFNQDQAYTQECFPRVRYLSVQARAVVPFSDLAIPQNVEASVWYGATISLSCQNPDDFTAPLDSAPAPYKFNYGAFQYGLHAQYESSSDFDEQALAGGLELRYIDVTRAWLPSTVVQVDAVRSVSSESRDALGLENSAHGRVGVRGYWWVELGTWLEAELDGAYFWTFGLEDELQAGGFEDGPYGAITVGYRPHWPVGSLEVASIFTGYAYGNLPTGPRDQKAWTIGLEVGSR